MIITTHALATIGVGKLLGIQTSRDWFLAFLFGVLPDLDHLKIFLPKYFNGEAWQRFYHREYPIRSFIQEPISLLWVVPLSFYLASPVPMAAWSVHVFLDYLVDGARKPFWPLSHLTLKSGLLPSFALWEWLLVPIFFLVFLWKMV